MATPLTGKSQNSPRKIGLSTYGRISVRTGSGGKMTPLTGASQNSPRGTYPKMPQVKAISIPLPVRKPDGTLRMGNGS